MYSLVAAVPICFSTGQFQNGNVRLSPGPAEGERAAWMWRGTSKVPVTEVSKILKDSAQKAHKTPCWLVKHRDVEALLGAPYSSYLAFNPLEM